MGKKCAIYCRVSTLEQAEKGSSLESQLAGCRAYAAKAGFQIVAELADDCSGVSHFSDRPQGKRLWQLVGNQEIDVVLLYTHDRTGRDKRGLVYLLLKDHIYEHHAELHYADKGIDPDTYEGNLVGKIASSGAGKEHGDITERTMRGKKTWAERGRFIAVGQAPFGYEIRKQFDARGNTLDVQLVIDESEATIIRQIYADYLSGMSGHAIARKLSEKKTPTPGESRGRRRKRSPGTWEKATVYAILENETYAGTWRWGKVAYVKDQPRRKRANSETTIVKVPAIVSPEDWQAAQVQRAHNKATSPRNNKVNEYLLRSRIKCGCGRNMVGCCNARGTRYYHCSELYHRFASDDTNCKEGYVRADDVEAWAWVRAIGFMQSRGYLAEKLHEAQDLECKQATPLHDRLTQIEKLLTNTEKQIARTAGAIAKTDNEIAQAALQRELDQAANELQRLKTVRDDTAAELANLTPLSDDVISQTLTIYTIAAYNLRPVTLEEKRAYLDWLQFVVTVKGGKPSFTTRLPIAPFEGWQEQDQEIWDSDLLDFGPLPKTQEELMRLEERDETQHQATVKMFDLADTFEARAC